MKTRRPSGARILLAAGALGLALAAAPVTPAAAQDRTECRCVDRDGNEIERCSCLRAPRIPGFVQASQESRPRLGISVDARQSRRHDTEGALVTEVLEDGPADEAGIREGDIITRVDGHSLFEPLEGDAEAEFDLDQSVPVQRLLALVRGLEEGQMVEVEYLRRGEAQTTTVEAEDLDVWGGDFAAPGWSSERLRDQMRALTERARAFEWRSPDSDEQARELRERLGDRRGRVGVFRDGDDAPNVILRSFGRDGNFVLGSGANVAGQCPSAEPGALFLSSDCIGGLELLELNEGLATYFGGADGVLVSDVHEDSTLGLEPGDVILSIGDREVSSPDQVRRILRSYDEDEDISFQIRREGRETSVSGRLSG